MPLNPYTPAATVGMRVNGDIFQINTSHQAVEYLTFVNHVGSGYDRQLLLSANGYDPYCRPQNNSIEGSISVTALDDHWLVKMSWEYYDDVGTHCNYGEFKVFKNGTYTGKSVPALRLAGIINDSKR